MKGTAMAVVLTVASASSCNIAVPPIAIKQGARLSHFSCDDLSSSCCAGLKGVEQLLEHVGSTSDWEIKKILKKDLIGTCGRADQVNLYNCTVSTIPRLVPAGKAGKARALIQGKGCPNTSVSSGTDGSGQCTITVHDHSADAGTHQIDDVSAGCCAAAQAMLDAEASGMLDAEASGMLLHRSACGMIGACGKQDQQSILKFVGQSQRVEAKKEEALLLESYFTLGGAQDMLASLMTSEVEDDATEDHATEDHATEDHATEDHATEDHATEDRATEDGSQIMTGLLGFVAGAAVTGLGVTVLGRKSPSQDEYNQIVA